VLPLDVSSQQLDRQAALLRRLSEPARAQLVADLWATGRQLAEAGVRSRNPGASEPLVRWLLTSVIYDEATAVRLHGPRSAQ
jgi:hypothetical protein